MKCCASPTICSVDNATQRVGAAFESLLLAEMLEPLAKENDAFGDYGVTVVAQSIAAHDTHGFAALIAKRLDGP